MINGHGGNIYRLAGQLGCRPEEISDMSANVNPLGPIPALVDHLKMEIQAIASLPEVDAGKVIRSFSRFYDVEPKQVMAGNGTTELIYIIPRAIRSARALVVEPTYADYKDACKMNRIPFDHLFCKKENNFVPDMDAIEKAASKVDLVFICNPNNPTGAMVSRSDLESLCISLPGTLFVIDESYLPFAPVPAAVTMMGTDLSNVIVLNSMSKAFRVPGLRIGFIKTSEVLLEKLASYALPWSVNSLAQKAVEWLMTHPGQVNPFLENTRAFITSEKSRFKKSLENKTRVRCFPSVTSFLLLGLPNGLNAHTVWQTMATNRILIRDCANFKGLSDKFIRISLKSEKENSRAADLLIQLCQNHTSTGDNHAR